MSLRVTEYARSQRLVELITCPACGYEFDDQEPRHVHLVTHDPEDFGLSALGDRPTGEQPGHGGVRP